MSFLIKGMDMPTEGGVIVIYKEGNSFYTTKAGEGKRYPLVPVPPHSRLIDAKGNVGVNVRMMSDGKCEVDLIAPTIISTEEEE